MSDFPVMEQDEREFSALLALLQDERPAPASILEIGVFQGGTLARFAHAFPDATVVGIDTRPMIQPETQGLPPIVCGSSDDTLVRQRARSYNDGEPFDFVFIDGDHTYAAVRKDWEWAQFEANVIAFHDIAEPGERFGTRELWLQIRDKFNPHGVTGKRWRTREFCYDALPQNGIGVVWT